jgi:peptidyl-prolyl cis-trans isomerase C
MKYLKDPLVTFLIVGAGIFLLAGYYSEENIPYAVDVREADISRMNDQWSMQMRRPATERELSGLVNQFVKEEIYYREAQRMGLDANDTIVRRRMVQKLTFLTEDIATATPFDADALQAFYADNQADYRVPERFSFSHGYFSSDRREDAQGDATGALTTEEKGDPFMLQREYTARSEREIGDLFGRGFAEALNALTVQDTAQGPIESAYGWHTIRLTDRTDSFIPAFEDVAERVAVDAQQDARRAANEAYYEDLKSRYTITLPSATTAGVRPGE